VDSRQLVLEGDFLFRADIAGFGSDYLALLLA
jgi:hypothetical protein